jgi:CheY-like chemotaxis protein
MLFKEFKAMLAESSEPKPESIRGKPPSGQRPPILVVDDNAAIRSSLELLLSSRYHVIVCASAAEGLQAFTQDMCAVVLDIKMSGHDGFWACDEIRKLQPDIPIIFYSAYQDAKDPFEIINAHRPFGYITKDGDPQKLLNALETATCLHQGTLRSRRLIERLKSKRAEGGT